MRLVQFEFVPIRPKKLAKPWDRVPPAYAGLVPQHGLGVRRLPPFADWLLGAPSSGPWNLGRRPRAGPRD